MLDESDSSCSEASSMAGATLKRPVPNSDEVGILPRIHHNWTSEKNNMPSPPQHPEWHFPRNKLRLQTVLGQGNFGQVSQTAPLAFNKPVRCDVSATFWYFYNASALLKRNQFQSSQA
jgi:hypothetical protein